MTSKNALVPLQAPAKCNCVMHLRIVRCSQVLSFRHVTSYIAARSRAPVLLSANINTNMLQSVSTGSLQRRMMDTDGVSQYGTMMLSIIITRWRHGVDSSSSSSERQQSTDARRCYRIKWRWNCVIFTITSDLWPSQSRLHRVYQKSCSIAIEWAHSVSRATHLDMKWSTDIQFK